jgi:hypothetical protein
LAALVIPVELGNSTWMLSMMKVRYLNIIKKSAGTEIAKMIIRANTSATVAFYAVPMRFLGHFPSKKAVQ